MLSIDKHINVIGCHIIIIKSASGFSNFSYRFSRLIIVKLLKGGRTKSAESQESYRKRKYTGFDREIVTNEEN